MQQEKWNPTNPVEDNGTPYQPIEPVYVWISAKSTVEGEHGACGAVGGHKKEDLSHIYQLEASCDMLTFWLLVYQRVE